MASFQGRDLISIRDLSRADIEAILDKARAMADIPVEERRALLRGKTMASLFFEPSTRTRTSFNAAMRNLGGWVEGFADPKTSSVSKMESLWDTIKIYDGYGYSVFVIRHPLKGAARLASDAAEAPVINAGDGANQHPTQTLLDLYTILETQGRIDGLRVGMVGDLAHGRTVHSLTQALLKFRGVDLYFVSSRALKMPGHLVDKCRARSEGVCEEVSRIEEVIGEVDILYMTRVQKERFGGDHALYEKVKNIYRLSSDMLVGVRENLKVLHPLPRVDEIATDVDSTPYAYYFQQARNGLRIRETLLAFLTGALQ